MHQATCIQCAYSIQFLAWDTFARKKIDFISRKVIASCGDEYFSHTRFVLLPAQSTLSEPSQAGYNMPFHLLPVRLLPVHLLSVHLMSFPFPTELRR